MTIVIERDSIVNHSLAVDFTNQLNMLADYCHRRTMREEEKARAWVEIRRLSFKAFYPGDAITITKAAYNSAVSGKAIDWRFA